MRTYVAVDGGMSDNLRPVTYGARYEAFLPRGRPRNAPALVTIAGKHCEQGDVIVRDAHLPADVAVGDVLATPVTGAYCHSMASNYNKVTRPAVVFVRDGDARLVVRRETEPIWSGSTPTRSLCTSPDSLPSPSPTPFAVARRARTCRRCWRPTYGWRRSRSRKAGAFTRAQAIRGRVQPRPDRTARAGRPCACASCPGSIATPQHRRRGAFRHWAAVLVGRTGLRPVAHERRRDLADPPRPGDRRARARRAEHAGATRRGGRRPPRRVSRRSRRASACGGLPVTSPARTLIDLAGVLDDGELASVVTSVTVPRRLVTVRAVRTRLDEIGYGRSPRHGPTPGAPGADRFRAGRSSARMAG